MNQSYQLSLSDGSQRHIVAGDAGAVPIVEMLARTMMFAPGHAGHVLRVLTGQKSETITITDNAITYSLLEPKDDDDLVSKTMQVSLAIAHEVQRRGGILVHGALAEHEGTGVILAAPGNTGKTTASSRLPRPWRSRSDDATLIVRDWHGNYFAHPWPTWSLFYNGGPGGAWDTAAGIPLQAFYFMFQSQEDALDELIPSQAAAMLIESVEQANRAVDRRLPPLETKENHLRQFSIVCALTMALPAYRLQLTLTGNFWKLLEESLKRQNASRRDGRIMAAVPAVNVRKTGMASPGVTFSGNSMYPTLKEPDYLEIRPYEGNKPRRGDVIYFRAPQTGTRVVHRIMAVQTDGLLTKGDNNALPDEGIVHISAVEGRVVASRGVGKERRVNGGVAGMRDYYYARLFRKARKMAGMLSRLINRYYPLTGILRFLRPDQQRFQIVFFGAMPLGHLKILANNLCVGQYVHGVWHIAYPWRLLVDPARIAGAAEKYETAKARWRQEFIANRHLPTG